MYQTKIIYIIKGHKLVRICCMYISCMPVLTCFIAQRKLQLLHVKHDDNCLVVVIR